MTRYNIDNNSISVAYCQRCGYEVGIESRLDINNTEKAKVTNRNIGSDRINTLKLLEHIMACCEKPSYSYR